MPDTENVELEVSRNQESEMNHSGRASNTLKDELVIGEISSGAEEKPFTISTESIRKHILVCGITRSGKSNTCFQLAEQLWEQGNGGRRVSPI